MRDISDHCINKADGQGMDVFFNNENGPNWFFKNDGAGQFSQLAGQMGVQDSTQNGRSETPHLALQGLPACFESCEPPSFASRYDRF